MNRKITIGFGLLLIMAVASFGLFNLANPSQYSPRETVEQSIDGYFEYLASLRKNQVTGTVDRDDVAAVLSQIDEQRGLARKKGYPLQWDFSGPDNIGGRTRCLVIDKDNSNIMYTGGVSGLVYKSVNKGGSWYPLTLDESNFGVTSMAQTSDGALYYGTGEQGHKTAQGQEEGSPTFNGFGIFKSTDGETFTLLTNTLGFGYINVIEKHPTENGIFVGSQNGLRYSNDGGATWTLVKTGQCRDIKLNKNGVALAFSINTVARSTTPTVANSFTNVTSNAGNIISLRAGVAWSDSDPNYCYIVSVGNNIAIDAQTYRGALNGFYRSTDAGVTWTKEVNQASLYFAPFTTIGLQAQGNYNLAIGVHPYNRDRVFIGGIGFAEWTPNYGPKIVGNNFDSPLNPFGIHADKHYITFDTTGETPIMYICSDGGIAKTTNAALTNYAAINVGYNTTQYYGIAASISGKLLGGTQDNNTILISKETFPRKTGVAVIGGDGFQAEISEYNDDIMFGESQQGRMQRSITGGDNMSTIWDNRIKSSFVNATTPTGYFNAPLTLWEDPASVEQAKTFGRTPQLDSAHKARLFIGLDNGIWMCNNATGNFHNPDKPSNDNIRWFRVASTGNVHFLHATTDGNSMFIGGTNGRVYRVDGLNKANFDTTELAGYTAISDSLNTIDITNNLGAGGRTITSIEVDPQDDNHLVVTAGGYGNSNFVYECKNALDPSPTWSSIQTNLPLFPVYHAIISVDDPDVIVLGTEFGIWSTQNASGGSPVWEEANQGVDADLPFPRVPVFELVQVESKSWTGPIIYAGTHGMGIWESGSLQTTSTRNNAENKSTQLKAYPNPANGFVTLESDIKGSYDLEVYDLSGRSITSQSGNSNGDIRLNTQDLTNGYYFVQVSNSTNKAVVKILVQH